MQSVAPSFFNSFCTRLSIVTLSFLLPSLTLAQNSAGSGSVSGSVYLDTGSPAAGVHVCLRQITRCTDTDGNGAFHINTIPEGSYSVVFSKNLSDNSTLLSGGEAKLDVRSGVDNHFEFTLPKEQSLTESNVEL